jgi:hypothetical protein
MPGFFGCGWAFCFARSYDGDPGAMPAVTEIDGLPPWHSTHPSFTVPLGCIVGSSVVVWQVRQPAD